MSATLLRAWGVNVTNQAAGTYWLKPGGYDTGADPSQAFDVSGFNALRLEVESLAVAVGTVALDLVELVGSELFNVWGCGGGGFNVGSIQGPSAVLVGRALVLPSVMPTNVLVALGMPMSVCPRATLTGSVTWRGNIRLWGVA